MHHQVLVGRDELGPVLQDAYHVLQPHGRELKWSEVAYAHSIEPLRLHVRERCAGKLLTDPGRLLKLVPYEAWGPFVRT